MNFVFKWSIRKGINPYNRIIICAFLLVLFSSSYSQNINSEIENGIAESQRLLIQGDTSTGIELAKRIFEKAKEIDDLSIAIAGNNLGSFERISGNYSQAFSLYWNSYFILMNVPEPHDSSYNITFINTSVNIGDMFFDWQLWGRAVYYYLFIDSILIPEYGELYQTIKNKIILSYYALEQYDKVIERCNVLLKNTADQKQKIFANRKIADSYNAMAEHRNAISYEEKLLLEIGKNDSERIVSLIRIAEWYRSINDNDKAIVLYSDILKSNSIDIEAFLKSKYYLSRLYLDKKDFTVAQQGIDELLLENKLQKYNYLYVKTVNLWVLWAVFQEDFSLAYNRISDAKSKYNIEHYIEHNIDLNMSFKKIGLLVCEKLNKNKEALKYSKEINNLQLQIKKENEQDLNKQLKTERRVSAKGSRLKFERASYELSRKDMLYYITKKEKQQAEFRSQQLSKNQKLLAIIVLISAIAFIVALLAYRNRKKINLKLNDSNSKLQRRTEEAEDALVRLKELQSQLLESEKLASLGQLTAGIAHEIRNPLNFVTNYSSLNDELFEEIDEIIKEWSLENDDWPESMKGLKVELKEILQLIAKNNSKVNSHGKRAAHIISSMLSAYNKGVSDFSKTEINQLVKESSVLAYEGVRGSNPSFRAQLVYDFDDKLGEISVSYYDLTRVIINIVNNACSAIEDRIEEDSDFEGKIVLSTKDIGSKFMISVMDNGKGMSEDVRSKIFNPFFTTKPANKGTGLGLTMAYDTIVKDHKGELKVESKLGEYAKFIIVLPKDLK